MTLIHYEMYLPDNRNVTNFASFRKKWEINTSMNELCSYLTEHRNERIILRQLHRDLDNNSEPIDHVIERAIKNNWISRENREYNLLIPVLNEEDLRVEEDVKKNITELIKSQILTTEDELVTCCMLVYQLREQSKTILPVLFHVNEESDNWASKSILRTRVAETENINVLSLNYLFSNELDMLDFFVHLREETDLNEDEIDLFECLGDVNPAYFVDEMAKLLLLPSSKRVSFRPLFTASLKMLDIFGGENQLSKHALFIKIGDYEKIKTNTIALVEELFEMYDSDIQSRIDNHEVTETLRHYRLMSVVSDIIQTNFSRDDLPFTLIVEK